MENAPPQPELIEKLLTGVYPSFCLLAGLQLGVFTSLSDGPLTGAEAATRLGVQKRNLEPLLYALAATGLLEVDGDRFGNTPESQQYLVEGGLTYIGDLHNLLSGIWAAGLKTAESIRTDTPVEKHDFSKMAPEHLEGFFRALHFEALGIGCELAERPEFALYRSLLDVGGGSGGVAISLAESLPHVNATVVDLPEVIPITKRYISEAGVSDRVSTLANDVTREPIDGEYDAAIMKSFIQSLSQEQANQAVRNVAAALKSGGRLYIMGNGILDDSRVSPPDAATFNIVFLGLYDEGRAYTEGEYRSIVEQGGLVDFKREIDTDGGSLITARKPS
jgi:SAM-dependent methyltransferase